MYFLEVTTSFSAAHALRFGDPVQLIEPLHGHDFHVTATIEGRTLDADGLLLDFHAVERELNAIAEPFRNRTLNEVPPFDRTNPTAELLARHIGERLADWLETQDREHPKDSRKDRPRVRSVRITEAVGCAAVYVVPPR